MAKYKFIQKYAEGSNVSRGRFDQLKRQEKGPEKNFGNFVGDVGKWALNQALTPIETISGRNFYDPEFTYDGMNKMDAVTSGISSAATDIAGTYFLGPFYTGGKKLIQGGVNKLDADGSWDNTNAQVAMLGGNVQQYYDGSRVNKQGIPRYFDASMVMNMMGGQGGGFDMSQLSSMFSNMGGNSGSTGIMGNISSMQNNPNLGNIMSAPLFGQNPGGGSSFLSAINPNLTGTPGSSNPNTMITYNDKGNIDLGATWENRKLNLGVGQGEGFGADFKTTMSGMGDNMMSNMKGMSLNQWGSVLTEGDPNTMAIAGTDAGRNTRNWSGIGNFVSNIKGDTVQEQKAKNIKQDEIATIKDAIREDSDMLRYSSEGAGNVGVVDQGNPMLQSHLLEAIGTQNVRRGWADRVGQGIAQAGDLVSGFVSGDASGAMGTFQNLNNISNVTGANIVERGGPAKHKYNMGSKVNKQNVPAGLQWDGNMLNVPENYQGYFTIPGKDHEQGGTLMNTPAEKQGNTIIEAELNEGAEVKDGETYIYSKTTKHPDTGETFKKRKDKREKESLQIDKLLANEDIKKDQYKYNTLMRRKTTLLLEEESDRSLQDDIKATKELKEELQLNELLASGTNISKKGTYRKGGRTRKLSTGQQTMLGDMISNGIIEEFEDGGKPKKPKRPFMNPTNMSTYAKELKKYKEDMKIYNEALKKYEESQASTTDTTEADVIPEFGTKEWDDQYRLPNQDEQAEIEKRVLAGESYDDILADINSRIQTEEGSKGGIPKFIKNITDKIKSKGKKVDQPTNKPTDILDDDLPFSTEIDSTGNTRYMVNQREVTPEEYDEAVARWNEDPENFAMTPFRPGYIETASMKNPTPTGDDAVPLNLNAEVPRLNLNPPVNPPEGNDETVPTNDNTEPTVPGSDEDGIPNFLKRKPAGPLANNEDSPVGPSQDNPNKERQDAIIKNRKDALTLPNIPANNPLDIQPGNPVDDLQNDLLESIESKEVQNPPVIDPRAPENDPLTKEILDQSELQGPKNNPNPVEADNTTTEEGNNPPRGTEEQRKRIEELKKNKGNRVVNVDEDPDDDDDANVDNTEVDNTDDTDVDNTNVDNTNVDNTNVDNTNPGGVTTTTTTTTEENKTSGGGDPNQFININQPSTSGWQFMQHNINPYDWLGAAGLTYGALAGRANTEENWDKTTPNINFMEDVYKKPIHRLNMNTEIIDAANMNTKRGLREDLNTQLQRIRGSSNSFQNVDARSQNAYNTYADKMIDADIKYGLMNLGLQKDIADLEGKDRKLFLEGEGVRDLADREDLDNYYTQRGVDIQNTAKNMMELAKNGNASAMEWLKQQGLGNITGGGDDPIDYTKKETKTTVTHSDGTICPGPNCTHKDHDGTDGTNKTEITNNNPCANLNCAEDEIAVFADNDCTCVKKSTYDDPNTFKETITEKTTPGLHGHFQDTYSLAGNREFSGTYSDASGDNAIKDGTVPAGFFQEYSTIFYNPSGSSLSEYDQSGSFKKRTEGAYGDDAQWPGVDNTIGFNTKNVAKYYGTDFVRDLMRSGQYIPGAKKGEKGYWDGTITDKDGRKIQLDLNVGENVTQQHKREWINTSQDPSQWSEEDVQLWLKANPDKTREDLMKFSKQMYGGFASFMHGGSPRKGIDKYWWGGKNKKKKNKNVESTTGLSENVVTNYQDLFNLKHGLDANQTVNLLNQMNITPQDTLVSGNQSQITNRRGDWEVDEHSWVTDNPTLDVAARGVITDDLGLYDEHVSSTTDSSGVTTDHSVKVSNTDDYNEALNLRNFYAPNYNPSDTSGVYKFPGTSIERDEERGPNQSIMTDFLKMLKTASTEEYGGPARKRYMGGGNALRGMMVGPAGMMSDSIFGKGTTNSLINKMVPGLGTGIGAVSEKGGPVLRTSILQSRKNNSAVANKRIEEFRNFMKNRK